MSGLLPGEGAHIEQADAYLQQIKDRGLAAVVLSVTAISGELDGSGTAAVVALPNTETAQQVSALIQEVAARIMSKWAVNL